MSVRAKFVCNTVEHSVGGAIVKLTAVTSGSAENDQFFKWTPSAEVKLGTINPEAAKQFEPGKSYYVDFTPAEQ